MPPTALSHSVPDRPRRGRQIAAETVAQAVEGWQYEQLAELTLGLTNIDPYWAADDAEDSTRREVRRLAARLLDPSLTRREVHMIAAAIERVCADGDRHDAEADARIGLLVARVQRSQAWGRHTTAWIERAETGTCRNQPEYHPTPAEQEALL